jgi:hypothetical protein
VSARAHDGHRDTMGTTSVLVINVGSDLAALSESDFSVYSEYYSGSRLKCAENGPKLLEIVSEGFDIVHLLCRISDTGLITGSQLPGISCSRLLDETYQHGTKLLFIALENPKEAYINGVKLGARKMNVIMTLNRQDGAFARFLGNLARSMAAGEPMVRAWTKVAPQIGGTLSPDLPACIFVAGLPNALFSS